MKNKYLILSAVFILLLAGCGSVAVEVEYGQTPPAGVTAGQSVSATPMEIPGITRPVTVDGLELKIFNASRVEQYTKDIELLPKSNEKIFLVVKAKVLTPGVKREQVMGWLVFLNDNITKTFIQLHTGSSGTEYGVDQVTWIFEVEETSTSFTIHLPGGVDVPLNRLVYAPTPTLRPTATRVSPTPIQSPDPAQQAKIAVAIAAGREHSCAVTAAGGVKCWGSNDHGQLGDGSLNDSAIPVDVAGLTNAVAVTAGWKHTCALTASGGVKCWGYNKNGELGNGKSEDSPVPVPVSGLKSGVTMIDAGDDHTCAVGDQGIVRCWGYNEFGQLGDGTRTSRSIPVFASATAGGAKAVAAGWGHSCVITGDGSAACWGNGELGQLGDGQQKEDYRLTAVTVAEVERAVVKLAADGGQSCVLTIYGGIRCWGNNKYGQLGDGTSETRNSPVRVAGLTPDQRELAVGWNHSCGVDGKGGLRCWGWNLNGQLGDGTKTSRIQPAGEVDLPEGVRSLALGFAHSCAVTESGAVYCWGSNEFGQLGDGSGVSSQVPVAAAGFAGMPVATVTATPAQPTANHTATAADKPTRTSTVQGKIVGVKQPVTIEGIRLAVTGAYAGEAPDRYGRIDLYIEAEILSKVVNTRRIEIWDIHVNGIYRPRSFSVVWDDGALALVTWYFQIVIPESSYVLNLPEGNNFLLDGLL
ncbi:MAG: RCC1 domain-containing protein [Anaerolineales bacterium]